MSGSVNKVILVGNLGADPRMARGRDGKPIASFSVATSESWRDQAGNRREVTEWHTVVVFVEALAEFAGKFLRKGSKVYVEGHQKTREYDSNGTRKRVTEVVLNGFQCRLEKLDRAEGRDVPDDPAAYGTARDTTSHDATSDDLDEIPL